MTATARILEVARSIRADAWVDFAPRGAVSVGFADNRDASTYNSDVDALAGGLAAAGFRVRVRKGDAHLAYSLVTARL